MWEPVSNNQHYRLQVIMFILFCIVFCCLAGNSVGKSRRLPLSRAGEEEKKGVLSAAEVHLDSGQWTESKIGAGKRDKCNSRARQNLHKKKEEIERREAAFAKLLSHFIITCSLN
jgi:hypothetical protein